MTQTFVADLITDRTVAIVDVTLPLAKARKMLDQPSVDTLVVLSQTGPCGVMRSAMLPHLHAADSALAVASNMTLVGPAIPGDMDAVQALRVMHGCGRNDLPVMNAQGEVVSLVSIADLLMVLDFELCEELVA